ncbi:MAG: glycosyltransferase family 4 protein, partial [Chloroflexota bacterium]|nr:glycosyltransferase family 4 protein [Chloroflexota bacterium]
MQILYLSQYFPPEVGATQTRAHEMARGLVQAGHQVTIITEVPNHPHGIIPAAYRGRLYERATLDGIDVIRVWVKASPVKDFRSRMAFYLSYMLTAALAGLFLARGKFDVIYATSPPLFVGGAALIISGMRRIPLIFEVRDLWPESAVALGELKSPRAVRLASWLEERCYARARKIVVVTEGIRQRLLERGVAADKIALIPNGANTDLFQPQPAAGQALRQELGLADAFVVLYAGIHGIAQGLELLLDVARHLQNYTSIRFLFVGEGPMKAALLTQAQAMGLSNVIFTGEVARERVPAFLSMAGVAVVPLRKLALFEGALPSKMFDAWACACPTLVTIGGEAKAVLQQAGAGLWVEPEDAAGLTAAILALADDPARGQAMGERGRRFVAAHYSRQAQAQQLEQLLT